MFPSKESLTVEFKSDRKTISDDTIVEGVVALANTDGGSLYIGIEDNGTPTGAQPVHRDPLRIKALIASKTVPSVSVRAELEGKDVVVMHLEVARSASIVATSSGKILRRRLKTDGSPERIPMYPYEISTRLSDLGKLDLSAQPVPDATREDFDPIERDRLRHLVETNPMSDQTLLGLSDEELEKSLRLITVIGGKEIPTLTGLLMIGKQASLESFVPTHQASFQVLQGTDIKSNVSYTRSLVYTIEKINELIEPWNQSTEIHLGLFSQQVPDFDKRAIREALVNAFGHRDYSILGRVRVQIDDNGLQIVSPGGFIEGISINNLLTAEPHGKNPCLMDALKRVGLAERTGRGVDRIFEGSLKFGRPLPDYSASNATNVSLFIARSKPDTGFVQMLEDEQARSGKPLSLQALLVLDVLKQRRRCTVAEFSELVDIPMGQLKNTLESLIEAGLLEAVGSGKHRSYVLSHSVYKKEGKSKEYVRQTDIDRIRYPEMILKLVEKQGRITTSDVQELLHLEASSAYYEIKKLIDQKKLKSIKKGRNSYYEIA